MTDIADWSGAVGAAWAQEWRRTDRSFAGLAPRLDAAILDALSAGARRVVDIGCGAGTTALTLATTRADLDVIGVDVSAPLVAVATERATALSNLHVVAGAAIEVVPRLAPVDLLVSRHGVMFFDDPAAAFAVLRSACSAGAALVFSCFRSIAENPWASAFVPGGTAPPSIYVPGPFAFADPRFVIGLLEQAGWTAVRHEPVDYRYVAGAGPDAVDDALSLLSRIGPAAVQLRETPAFDCPALLAQMTETLERHRDGDEVVFPAAAWLWSARSGDPQGPAA